MPVIDHALDALLGAIIKHDADRAVVPIQSGRVTYDIAAFARDPVSMSLRLSLRHLGQMIADLNDTPDAMSTIATRAIGMDADNSVRRLAVLNDAWRGLTGASQRWSATECNESSKPLCGLPSGCAGHPAG